LLGLASLAGDASQEGTSPFPGTNFVAPPARELARHFPQLEILELLGQGGMGAVYKARQPKLDRLVAVKILPPEWGKDPAFAERFAREAKALARLTHPHIVAVHDFGETDGLFYLIMEYVDGANLRHILQEGRMKPMEALAVIPQICDALQYAHEEGVVHRDIKPENILLDSKGRVKIADFGLAKLLNRPRAAFTLTGSQQVMGTLDYMAPEQRLRPQEVDHRADIYSLGVVFYEMLTGELPLGRFEPPSQKVKIDARLDEVVFRALEREPARRYQRASEVKMDVESIATGRRHPRQVEPAAEAIPLAHAGIDQFALAGPAAGLFLAGLLGLLFWTVMGIGLFAEASRMRLGEQLAYLQMPLLGIPAGLALIIGSRKMAHAKSYYWSIAASIWAMMPWSPAWLIGLPSGIWALATLRRPEVQRLFGVNVRQRNQIIPPAVGLLLAGVTGGLFWIIMGFTMFIVYENTPYRRGPEPVFAFLMIVGGGVAATILIRGALRMMRMQSYQSSVMAALWGCVPWSPAWVMALPFGIWALRVLGRREVQLAFGMPFQQHERPFEAPMAAIPVAAVAPEPPEPTGPVRRGVRDFLGSMYSLMFHSRVDVPRRSEASAPVLTAQPANRAEPISSPRMYERQPAMGLPHRPTAKRHTVVWVVGIVLVTALIVGGIVATTSMTEMRLREMLTRSMSPRQHGILMDKYDDLNTTLHLEQWGVRDDVRKVFESTEQEYLALEARYTKRERKADGHLTVTIGKFPEEVKQIESRFFKKLESMYALAPIRNQIRGLLPENSLFPFGVQEARIELWRADGQYHGKVYVNKKVDQRVLNQSTGKVIGGEVVTDESPTEEFSGPELPTMYKRFWTESPNRGSTAAMKTKS
jgi:tRNA A-37 threonylcarbamoyl transferase component Bud32